jgi:hypothetical protein
MKAGSVRIGAISLLMTLMAFSSVHHPLLILLFPYSEELKCYCCLDKETTDTLKCSCGCNKHIETDTSGLLIEAVPSRSHFNIYLALNFGQPDFFFPPESVWLEVPTRPPKSV